jgi:hypothetical protein
VAEATTNAGRRADFGWRVAGVLLAPPRGGIFVVAVALTLFFQAQNSVFLESDNIKNITESMAPIA